PIAGGINMKLINNRLRFTGTYITLYNRNPLFGENLTRTSGFSSRLSNRRLIRSRVLEFRLGTTTIYRPGWTWDVNLNWSKNRTSVEELSDNLQKLILWEENGGGAITFVGEEIGNLYSRGYASVKDPNTPYYRWPILDIAGEWIELSGDENMKKVGNFNPDFVMGMQTSL